MALIYVYGLEDKVIYEDVSEDIIILAPSFYWYKLCSIPTRSFSKAKNIAQHMMSQRPAEFVEIILYKNNDDYDAYAYDKSFVKNLLKDVALKNPKVYFANQLQIEEAVSIDGQRSLYKFNERVMCSASTANKPAYSLVEKYAELLHGQKYLKAFEKQSSNNNFYFVASLALFALYIVFFSFDKMQTLRNVENELESLQTQDRSFHEIRSLIRKYEKLDTSSEKLQKDLQNALKKDQIKTIVYENDSIEVKR